MDTENHTIYHHISGTVCMIGYGSIGTGFVPLLKRHLTFDKFVIIDPINCPHPNLCDEFIQVALTKENFVNVLEKVFEEGKGFCVNLSVGTSSRQIARYCQEKGILYIDTVVEEWQGYYSDASIDLQHRSNYGLRTSLHNFVKEKNYKTTAISCCGANPGMVSWFVKQGLMDLAHDIIDPEFQQPKSRQQWGELMKMLEVKGIHIAERDTQRSSEVRKMGHFWNTWSVDGFIAEGLHQPSELGWGTHEKWKPPNAVDHTYGEKYAISLDQPGMNTMIKSWCPTPGPQLGFMITHDESMSITQYYSLSENGNFTYKPTVFYAYHPCEDAVNSCLEILGTGEAPPPEKWKILNKDITEGMDELGVLIYGHKKNAYWYGSQLDIHRTRKIASDQNATALQVTSAVLAGVVWALENPEQGLVTADELDYKRCLEVQRYYLEPMYASYTDWNPLKNQAHEFQKDAYDHSDPWQFKNMLLHK